MSYEMVRSDSAQSVMNRNNAPLDWLENIMKCRHHNVVIVAMVNKLARTVWALLSKAQSYEKFEDTVVA